jgi:hypothetical protein
MLYSVVVTSDGDQWLERVDRRMLEYWSMVNSSDNRFLTLILLLSFRLQSDSHPQPTSLSKKQQEQSRAFQRKFSVSEIKFPTSILSNKDQKIVSTINEVMTACRSYAYGSDRNSTIFQNVKKLQTFSDSTGGTRTHDMVTGDTSRRCE